MKSLKSQPEGTSEIDIFGRLIGAENGDLALGLAKYLLTLGFSVGDQTRMKELSERNQQGTVSPAEKMELQNYVRASHLLALLQSKARKSLKKRRAS